LSFRRPEKQASTPIATLPPPVVLLGPREAALLDRKDKQAGPMRLFIVFSPTGKTSKPTATLQANTTGAHNVAIGQGSSFPQKRQASSSSPGTRGRCVFFVRKDKQAFIHRLLTDI